MSKFHIVLFAPDIPGNTGSIGRTCVALESRLILIKPYGFEITEKALRRAGLDYWKYVDLTEYESFDEFIENENPNVSDLYLFTKTTENSVFDATFSDNSYLIFGSETKGLPDEVLEKYQNQTLCYPMKNDKVRSLNLSNVATAAAYECLRQQSSK
jgi:tRNA (cytidine/uridine-2'-O-)-methyltransferase